MFFFLFMGLAATSILPANATFFQENKLYLPWPVASWLLVKLQSYNPLIINKWFTATRNFQKNFRNFLNLNFGISSGSLFCKVKLSKFRTRHAKVKDWKWQQDDQIVFAKYVLSIYWLQTPKTMSVWVNTLKTYFYMKTHETLVNWYFCCFAHAIK